MIEQVIRDRVAAHYKQPGAILMLSDLGKDLRALAQWPIDGEERSLAGVVEHIEGLVLVRDPVHRAFVVVVPEDQRALADEAIRARSELRWLRQLAHAALVAFCLDVPPDTPIFLRPGIAIEYLAGANPPPDSGFIPVEPEFRSRGLFVREISELPSSEIDHLARNVRGWCDKHGVSPESLNRAPAPRRDNELTAPTRPPAPAGSHTSALERLFAAQTPDVAAKMIVPLDIAVVLSRIA